MNRRGFFGILAGAAASSKRPVSGGASGGGTLRPQISPISVDVWEPQAATLTRGASIYGSITPTVVEAALDQVKIPCLPCSNGVHIGSHIIRRGEHAVFHGQRYEFPEKAP